MTSRPCHPTPGNERESGDIISGSGGGEGRGQQETGSPRETPTLTCGKQPSLVQIRILLDTSVCAQQKRKLSQRHGATTCRVSTTPQTAPGSCPSDSRGLPSGPSPLSPLSQVCSLPWPRASTTVDSQTTRWPARPTTHHLRKVTPTSHRPVPASWLALSLSTAQLTNTRAASHGLLFLPSPQPLQPWPSPAAFLKPSPSASAPPCDISQSGLTSRPLNLRAPPPAPRSHLSQEFSPSRHSLLCLKEMQSLSRGTPPLTGLRINPEPCLLPVTPR